MLTFGLSVSCLFFSSLQSEVSALKGRIVHLDKARGFCKIESRAVTEISEGAELAGRVSTDVGGERTATEDVSLRTAFEARLLRGDVSIDTTPEFNLVRVYIGGVTDGKFEGSTLHSCG
jgi:hypothetical protein